MPTHFRASSHWGRVTHICISKLTNIGSDNGLSPGRRQAIVWNNAVILLIGPLGTNFSEILIGIQTFSLKKIHLKMSFAKCRPFCLGLNVLKCRWDTKTKPKLGINMPADVLPWYLHGNFIWKPVYQLSDKNTHSYTVCIEMNHSVNMLESACLFCQCVDYMQESLCVGTTAATWGTPLCITLEVPDRK